MIDDEPLERVRDALLDSAGEDEYGVWELLAGVRTALPDVPEEQRRALARAALARLVDEGLVELVRGRALDGGPVQRADMSELGGAEAWEPAGDEPSYLSVKITPAGEEAYYDLLRRRAGESD